MIQRDTLEEPARSESRFFPTTFLPCRRLAYTRAFLGARGLSPGFSGSGRWWRSTPVGVNADWKREWLCFTLLVCVALLSLRRALACDALLSSWEGPGRQRSCSWAPVSCQSSSRCSGVWRWTQSPPLPLFFHPCFFTKRQYSKHSSHCVSRWVYRCATYLASELSWPCTCLSFTFRYWSRNFLARSLLWASYLRHYPWCILLRTPEI